MPTLHPIPAITFAIPSSHDISTLIAPPYDVLDQAGKDALLAKNPHNIVAIDLPHLPAKTVGPDATYAAAGEMYRQWLAQGVLTRTGKPAVFPYQQTYTARGRTFERRGLIANVRIKPFGKATDGTGGIHPHEQTFSGPKEDRMKLMHATKAQLSPIFGLHSDPTEVLHQMLSAVIGSQKPSFAGRTSGDGVLHQVWTVDSAAEIAKFAAAMKGREIFIADGHHRYTTALNYRNQLVEKQGQLPDDHPANYCLFVLIALQDPGMIVLPTHRVLGGMAGYSFEAFKAAAAGKLKITPFAGNDLAKLEEALPTAGPHAIGLYNPADAAHPLSIATTVEVDPLATTHGGQSAAWRALDVALVQHLIVEKICQPAFCKTGETVTWKFPHTIEEFKRDTNSTGFQLGLLVQSTPLESVRLVSEAGELMPQKSTFFYPKLATGLVINPLG